MKRLLAPFALVFLACQAPDGATEPEEPDSSGIGPSTPASGGREAWKVQPPRDTLFFAGCGLDTLALDRSLAKAEGPGGFTMAQVCWTDAIACTVVDGKRECEPAVWRHRYSGTFRREDSLLTFAYRYEGTTPPGKALPSGNHSGEASFKLRRIDWDSLLVLERLDAGGGPWRPRFEAVKVR